MPDILVKGGDYKIEDIVGHKDVIKNGGSVQSLPFHEGYSSTQFINQIKKTVTWLSFSFNIIWHVLWKKLNYIYVLTPKGITEKTKLTINFMKRKMKEYDELKSELKK